MISAPSSTREATCLVMVISPGEQFLKFMVRPFSWKEPMPLFAVSNTVLNSRSTTIVAVGGEGGTGVAVIGCTTGAGVSAMTGTVSTLSYGKDHAMLVRRTKDKRNNLFLVFIIFSLPKILGGCVAPTSIKGCSSTNFLLIEGLILVVLVRRTSVLESSSRRPRRREHLKLFFLYRT